MIYDIIIIGGGISGLYSAYKLLKKNNKLRVLVLEKWGNLGGRIQSFKGNINNTEYQFEEGAGRFNENHKLLIQLIKDLGLEKDIIKIDSSIKFVPSGNSYKRPEIKKFIDELQFTYINKVINFYKKFDIKNLDKVKTYTFSEYASTILDKDELKFIIDSFGYYKELVSMNAFDAIKLIDEEMNPELEFYTLISGMSSIIMNLKKKIIKFGGKIRINQNVNNINYDIKTNLFNISIISSDVITKNKIYKSKNCILAIPKPDLLQFNILNNDSNIKKMLHSVDIASLCRVYTIFDKKDIWFKNIETITTNNKIRLIIPIDKDKGLIMISYSDSKFADYWNNLDEKELMIQLKKNIKKTFHIEISNPIFTKKCYWDMGFAYWKKNKNSSIISKKILQPYNEIPLFICGENYSSNQGWIEGGLETSNLVIDKIMK
jgi:monoamine oxidase